MWNNGPSCHIGKLHFKMQVNIGQWGIYPIVRCLYSYLGQTNKNCLQIVWLEEKNNMPKSIEIAYMFSDIMFGTVNIRIFKMSLCTPVTPFGTVLVTSNGFCFPRLIIQNRLFLLLDLFLRRLRRYENTAYCSSNERFREKGPLPDAAITSICCRSIYIFRTASRTMVTI